MEPFFPAIWNVFHDGSIDRVVGEVPGTVTLHVDIEYLRKRFSEPGDCFVVTLPNCTKFSFQPYDDEASITNLSVISDRYLEILSAEMAQGVCRVFAREGALEVESSNGSIRLDAGRAISLQELLDAATKYWEDWKAKGSAK